MRCTHRAPFGIRVGPRHSTPSIRTKYITKRSFRKLNAEGLRQCIHYGVLGMQVWKPFARALGWRELSERLIEERFNYGYIFFEISGKSVALLQVIGRIKTEPDFALFVLPDESL